MQHTFGLLKEMFNSLKAVRILWIFKLQFGGINFFIDGRTRYFFTPSSEMFSTFAYMFRGFNDSFCSSIYFLKF
jgi:hypothetical protein